MYYVYLLIDPRNGVPFYVGKGKNTRYKDHFRDARKGICKNKHLERKILQIWNDGTDVIVEMVETFEDESLAFLLETNLISSLGRRDLGLGLLTNLTNGGEGVTTRSLETIRRNTEATKATKAKWSPEQKEAYRQRNQEAGRLFWSRLSDNEKLERTKHIRTRFANMTDAERTAWSDQCRVRHALINTQEWRDRITESCKHLWDDPDKRIAHGVLIREQKSKMSDEKKQQHRENTTDAVTQYWAAMSLEERQDRMSRMREHITDESHKKTGATRREIFQNETVEERAQRITRHKDAAKSVDWQEVSAKVTAKKKCWSDERKAKYSQKMSEVANRRWHKEAELAPEHMG